MWTINEALDSVARQRSSDIAIVDGAQRIRYDELRRRVKYTAAWLQAQGIGKGDKVALQGRNSAAWVIAYYAILDIGGVAVPVNHKLAAPETAYILAHSESRLWLVDADLHRQLDGAPPAFALSAVGNEQAGLPPIAPEGEQHDYRPVDVDDDDLAELLYTSGTTGKPKGCMHSHANVILAGTGSSLVYGLGPSDRVLLAMPIWHSFPLNNLLVGSLFVGATAVLLPEYHPVRFLETVQQERCTLFFGAPIAYLMAMKMAPDFASYDLSSVRAWLYGGGPIDSGTARMLAERYRSERFYQVFGMTETGPTGTALLPEEQVVKAGSIGRHAVSGCTVKVMRDDRHEAGPGEVGEIWMRCQSMMLGYYRDPAATAAAFHEGWYRTGDLVRIDEDGYLFIVDRVKDMIVTGGENVYSKEVEDVLAGHPAISEVAVVGMPHPEWGESVAAVVVARADASVDVEDIQAFCAERLAKYKVPRQVRVVEAMPRTPTGKVMKYQLRERLRAL
ncbi:class I adenylate-forming enzyme family protein [Cupriavidus gilardii]|uniref:class I adenylate-forming enzyme family protein n=1 Tax=Cupriavidus gilardii TaxID=82541 RepID=UPI0007E35B6F|nr:long-chain-fatty-acid--CoA ligase [Cupriavidus gilardii]